MRELYIYYTVTSANSAGARSAVEAFQNDLRRRHPTLLARLLKRPGTALDLQTWMETYASPGGVSDDMERDIEEAARALEPFITGSRNVEVFVPWVS